MLILYNPYEVCVYLTVWFPYYEMMSKDTSLLLPPEPLRAGAKRTILNSIIVLTLLP
jgi:hypothetical protein